MRAVLVITSGHAARDAGERCVAALQNQGIPARIMALAHDATADHATELLEGAGIESSSVVLMINVRDDATAELTGRLARGLVLRADTDAPARPVAGCVASADVAQAVEFIVRVATNPAIAAGRAKLFQSAAADAYAAGKASAWPSGDKTNEVNLDSVDDVLPTFFRTRRSTGTARSASVAFAPALRAVLTTARALAMRDGRPTATAEDLLSALVDSEENEAQLAWVAAGGETKGAVRLADIGGRESAGPVIFSRDAAALIAASRELAAHQNLAQTTTLAMAEAVANSPEMTAALAARGVDAKAWLDAMAARDATQEIEVTTQRTDVLPSIPAPRLSLRRLTEVSRLMENEHPAAAALVAQQARKSLAAAQEGEETAARESSPPTPDREPAEEMAAADGFWLKAPLVLKTRAHNPEVDAVETATDALLDGLLVACPTEHGYVLASDATNAGAVSRLTQLVSRDVERHPLTVMIHSTLLARPLAGATAGPMVDELAERFWPGPLTLVLARPARSFRGVSADDTIGLRMPSDYTALALLSMVGRPLATALALPRAARADGEDIAEAFGARVAAILDVGAVPNRGDHATVVRLGHDGAARLLRQGAADRGAISEVLGGGFE